MNKCGTVLPIEKSLKPYEKSARQNGPASLYTALLMDKGIFKSVYHRRIKPVISLKDKLRINTSIMSHSMEENHTTTQNGYVDTFLYIVETLPFHYLTIKAFFNNKYIYLNANFRALAEQLDTTIISKKSSDILSCSNVDEHPSVKSMRYLDRRAYLTQSVYWVEETALDTQGKTHVFYTWKVPVFHVSEENIPTGIVTLSLPFSQLPFDTSYVPFKTSLDRSNATI